VLLHVLAVLLVVVAPPSPVLAQAESSDGSDARELPDDDALFGDDDLLDDDALFGDDDLLDDDALFGDDSLLDDDDLFDESPEADAASAEAEAAEAPMDSADPAAPDDPAGAPAADGDPPGSGAPTAGVEEILIQGQRGSAIDVEAPVSATAFDAQDLEAMGVQDVSDIAAYTPNTEIRTTGATRPTFFIRGVGLNDFTANAAGAIAIYQDNVILGLPAIQLGQIFDVQNVNVLRGPQGTGAGRNASGGAIHIESRKPSGDWGGFLKSEFGASTRVGRYRSMDFEGALELPLLGDMLAARFAFRAEKQEPFVKNGCGGAPPIGPDRITEPGVFQPSICGETDRATIPNPNPPPPIANISALPAGLDNPLNDANRYALRAQLRFQPPEVDLDILFNVHGGRVDQFANVGEVIGTQGSIIDPDTGERIRGFFGGNVRGYRQPEQSKQAARIQANLGCAGDLACSEKSKRILGRRLAEDLDHRPFRGDYNKTGKERSTTLGGFLRLDWQLDKALVSSTTALETYERFLNTDADFSPITEFETKTDDDAWQFTEDLRVSGELDEYPVTWNSGFYYLMDSLDYDRRSPQSSSLPPVRAIYRQETWSGGVYVDGSWDFLDEFTLEGGVRYQIERKTFDQRLFRGNQAVCDFSSCKESQTFDAPTGGVSLVYHASEDVSFYWKYSRGWKSAQYSSGGGSGRVFTLADPETVDSFEVGVSGAWFDGRASLRLSAFHYSYQDYQVFITPNDAGRRPVRIVTNADDAEIYGAEFDATLEPLIGFVPEFFEGLVLRGRGGWLESEFVDFTVEQVRLQFNPPPDPSELIRVTIDYTGNRLPNTPRFSFSGSAEYTLDFGRYGVLIPRWDFSWTADTSFDQSNGRGAPNDTNDIFMPNYAIGQRAYWMHNIRLTYRAPSGRFEIAGWVRNLEDTVYKQLAYDASAVGLVGNIVGDPRTYGVTLSFTW
jgi:iron complex outermembrane receptor protein